MAQVDARKHDHTVPTKPCGVWLMFVAANRFILNTGKTKQVTRADGFSNFILDDFSMLPLNTGIDVHLEVPKMGVPQNRWFIKEKPSGNGWFWGTGVPPFIKSPVVPYLYTQDVRQVSISRLQPYRWPRTTLERRFLEAFMIHILESDMSLSFQTKPYIIPLT